MEKPAHPAVPLVCVKASDDRIWAPDAMFYVVARNGLFQCRNHEFFTSCTPARTFPSALGEQETFLEMHYPLVPRRLFELAVGFMSRVYDLYQSESIVLLAWDRSRRRYRLVVPPQEAVVTRLRDGYVIAESVKYDLAPLPAGQVIIASLHCHAREAAYSSATDQWDESYRTGVHVVIGRIHREPPDHHVEAVVDGIRFNVKAEDFLEGYQRRRTGIPASWLKQVRIRRYGHWPHVSWSDNTFDIRGNDKRKPDKAGDASPDAFAEGI